MNKRQIVLIHGGDSYTSETEFISALKNRPVSLDTFRRRTDWKSTLQEKLGDDFDVIQPQMPCKQNAQYAHWSIWFSRLLPLLQKNIIAIGHSLGAIFLVKYISEQLPENKIDSLFLVATPGPHTDDIGTFTFSHSLQSLSDKVKKIYLFHSVDDPIVPYTESVEYKRVLPQAQLMTFTDRQHFNQQEFPELVNAIQML